MNLEIITVSRTYSREPNRVDKAFQTCCLFNKTNLIDEPTTCSVGYTLSNGTCVDINECALETNDCFSKGMGCENSIGSYSCVTIPSCSDGFEFSNGSCVDVNECLDDRNDCVINGLKCENIPGSFKCVGDSKNPPEEVEPDPTDVFSEEGCPYENDMMVFNGKCVLRDACNSGFVHNEDGKCVNIDECKEAKAEGKSICPDGFLCFDINGSFECYNNTCDPGKKLRRNIWGMNSCYDINECTEGTHNCTDEQVCSNIDGGFICDCSKGYSKNSTTGECHDIDECFDGRKCDPESSWCNNTIGSYDCICKKGFRANLFGSCKDINECSEVSHDCPENSRCYNTLGGYDCRCHTGYVAKNGSCVLDRNKECLGISQGDTCTCPEGFDLHEEIDRDVCDDIDECVSNSHSCGSETICVNTFGHYRCMDTKCPDNFNKLDDYPK